MENELERTQKSFQQKEEDLIAQISELKSETDKQQKLIGQVSGDLITWVICFSGDGIFVGCWG